MAGQKQLTQQQRLSGLEHKDSRATDQETVTHFHSQFEGLQKKDNTWQETCIGCPSESRTRCRLRHFRTTTLVPGQVSPQPAPWKFRQTARADALAKLVEMRVCDMG